jgi:hypothetical protein
MWTVHVMNPTEPIQPSLHVYLLITSAHDQQFSSFMHVCNTLLKNYCLKNKIKGWELFCFVFFDCRLSKQFDAKPRDIKLQHDDKICVMLCLSRLIAKCVHVKCPLFQKFFEQYL